MKRPRIAKAKTTAPVIDNAQIARERQLSEPPPPTINRMMKHEVTIGDSVCYFADIEDVWEVTELHGPWLRAKKRLHNPAGEANQCFLTDTMVPLELARRLPRRRVDGAVVRRTRAREERPTIKKKKEERPRLQRKRRLG